MNYHSPGAIPIDEAISLPDYSVAITNRPHEIAWQLVDDTWYPAVPDVPPIPFEELPRPALLVYRGEQR